MKATYYNPCKKNDLKADYIVMPSFQVSPETTVPVSADTATMDFKGDLEIEYCGDDKILYNVEPIRDFFGIDWKAFGITIFVALLGFQAIIQVLHWLLFEFLGIETKAMREKKEEHELLINTAKEVELSERGKVQSCTFAICGRII